MGVMVLFPWFRWNGSDSREMGVFVSRLPTLVRAEERVQRVTIPGRSGYLTIKEGLDVYNGYDNDCVITVPSDADFGRLIRWLTGHGKAVFSTAPDFAYEADIAGIVRFERLSKSVRQAVVPFYFQPFKMRAIPDPPIVISAQSYTIYNPGDVESAPIVTVDYTGNVQITIGNYSMAFTALSAPIVVDCGAEIITDGNGEIWTGKYSGDFWRIPTGNSTVTVDKAGCTLSVKPEWRWR